MAEHFALVVFGLLVAVAGLVLLSDVFAVPYPIFLVLGGLSLGFVPGMPELELEPDLVLLIFLPPLLYSAAFFSSLRDLKANIRPIGLLSVGLVALTTVVVAGVAHWIVGLSWPVAFVLGAIVSPTDPVAATDRDCPRRGKPYQRRLRAGPVPDGPRRGRGERRFLFLGARFALRGGRGGGGSDRAPRRVRRRSCAPPSREPAGRDHDLAVHGLRGLPAG